MIEDYKLTEEQKLNLLPPDELSKKGVHCLIDNLGFLNAQEFLEVLCKKAENISPMKNGARNFTEI